MKNIHYREALRQALAEEMERDGSVFVMGEDVGRQYGGVFGVTQGLAERFGAERVRNTPISEYAIAGVAFGAAISGMRPVAEIMYMDWIHLALERFANGACMFSFISAGQSSVPLVLRTQIGSRGSAGPQHSQSLESWFMHIPGAKVVIPSTPYDAKGLLKSAIRDPDPVLFIEHTMLYGKLGPVPEEEYLVPIGRADVKREGADLTLIAYSRMLHEALAAADDLAREGMEIEVVDPRTLVPLDLETILRSVRKTGKAAVLHEAWKRGGAGAEIAAAVTENAFHDLDAPVRRIGALEVPIPQSPVLESAVVPNKDSIVREIRSMLQPQPR